MQCGINYWHRNSAKNISIVSEDARKYFDIDARIEFVYRDEKQKCYHKYSFYSDHKHADKARLFYDIHRAKLLKFIAYFNTKAIHLINEGEKPENKIYVPNYSLEKPLETPKRNYMEELKREYPNTKLSDREFETLILFANGCTTKQVAEIMCRSEVTIETHLGHIRKKTGCKGRRDLKIYVREHGWEGLEKFFLVISLIPFINKVTNFFINTLTNQNLHRSFSTLYACKFMEKPHNFSHIHGDSIITFKISIEN